MVDVINAITGGVMSVSEDRLEAYLSAGHTLADKEPTKVEPPKAEPKAEPRKTKARKPPRK